MLEAVTPKICEHGQYEGKGQRCRKHVTTAVVYRSLFATQITGNGEVPLYGARVYFTCKDHEQAEGFDVIERLLIHHYRARMEGQV